MLGFILYSESFTISSRDYVRFIAKSTEEKILELIYEDHETHFYLEKSDLSKIPNYSKVSYSTANYQSFENKTLKKIRSVSRRESKILREELKKKGCRLYESDVSAELKMMIRHNIPIAFHLSDCDESHQNSSHQRILNPKLTPALCLPILKVLSLDIETGKDGQVLSIGLHLWKSAEKFEFIEEKVLMRRTRSPLKTTDLPIDFFKNEYEMLLAFQRDWEHYDVDIIIGWSVAAFDLNFLIRRYQHHHMAIKWGRFGREATVLDRKNIKIYGRQIIDGPAALKSAYYKFDSYSLNFVSNALLNRSKDITQKDRWEEIERRFYEDQSALAFYNIEDCRLVSEIFQKTRLIDLYLARSQLARLPLDKAHLATLSFERMFLPELHKKQFAASDVTDNNFLSPGKGGYVFDGHSGLHKHVLVFDFKSLYPSIIQSFNIDPWTLSQNSKNFIQTPTGHKFSSEKSILGSIIAELMDERRQARKAGDAALSQAIKILMNSLYGVMGASHSRFYKPELPAAITGTGQWLLKKLKEKLNLLSYEVIYGDTDSVFVAAEGKKALNKSYLELGQDLCDQLNVFFKEELQNKFGLESHLELIFEKHYYAFFLPERRESNKATKKRYAGYIEKNGQREIEFVGLEFVRSDWTPLAKDFQKKLLTAVFEGDQSFPWFRDMVKDLRSGCYDDKLVYRKKLSKKLEDYTKTRPPHIKAALQLPEIHRRDLKKGSEIEYVQTTDGPAPTMLIGVDHVIDYDHYIAKQLKPLANNILQTIGLSWDDILVNNRLLIDERK